MCWCSIQVPSRLGRSSALLCCLFKLVAIQIHDSIVNPIRILQNGRKTFHVDVTTTAFLAWKWSGDVDERSSFFSSELQTYILPCFQIIGQDYRIIIWNLSTFKIKKSKKWSENGEKRWISLCMIFAAPDTSSQTQHCRAEHPTVMKPRRSS